MRHGGCGGPSRAGFPPATPGRHSARSSDGPHIFVSRPAYAIRPDQPGPIRLWPGSPTLAPLVVNATELGSWMVLSSTDTPTAAIAANNKAARKTFIVLPQSDFVELFRRHRAGGARRRRMAFCLFFLDPERVMLPGPVEIDLAGPHRVECALHPDGADIDVSQHHGDQEHGDYGMDHGPELQCGHIAGKVWE